MNAQFAAGLLNPEAAIPNGLMAPAGAGLEKRYAVYRNNVTSSLIDALEDGFPVCREILGERYFRAFAAEFVRSAPPVSPILSLYGDKLPHFIAGFPPLAKMPWLADIAKVELARREANDALDSTADAAATLAAAHPEQYPQLVPHLHPSTRWVTSNWPLFSLWNSRTTPDHSKPESVLVVRPALLVTVCYLPIAGLVFLQAVDGKRNLSDIAEVLGGKNLHTALPEVMPLLVQQAAIARFTCQQ